VPESYFDGELTITAIAFERAPMGSSSVILNDFKMSLGIAGGEELGRNFGGNLAPDERLQPVTAGSTVTAGDNGSGQVVFELDTPYEYTGGNLLIDMSFTNIQGSMYVWSWDAGGNRIVAASGANAETGDAFSFPPVIVIKGE